MPLMGGVYIQVGKTYSAETLAAAFLNFLTSGTYAVLYDENDPW